MLRSQRTEQGKHQQSHSSSVVVQLQSKLAAMSNNFKQVLEVRTENLKSQRSRAEQFSSGAVTTSLPQSATQVQRLSSLDVFFFKILFSNIALYPLSV